MIDLKDLLEERSAQTPGFDHLRLGLVHRRITRRRRQRLATTLAVVALLLFGGYAISPAAHTQKNPAPATTPSPTPAGNPDYANGRHRIASAIAPAADRQVTLTWTPVAEQQRITITCPDASNLSQSFRIEVRINDYVLHDGGFSCHTTFYTGASTFEHEGIPIGVPAKLTARLLEGDPGGFLMAAIWVEVSFDDYPLPKRPDALKTLEPFRPCAQIHGGESFALIGSDPADPAKPVRITVPAARYLNLAFQSSTPGHLRYGIEGQAAESVTFWDYSAQLHSGMNLEPAATTGMVTVTITPEKVSGPWQVAVIPDDNRTYCAVSDGLPFTVADVSPGS